ASVYPNNVARFVYPNLTSAGADVFQRGPCDVFYSDLVNLTTYVVNATTPQNTYTSYISLPPSLPALNSTLRNLPIVPYNITFPLFPGTSYIPQPVLLPAWYGGRPLMHIDLGAVSVPNPVRPSLAARLGSAEVILEMGSLDAGYSGFYALVDLGEVVGDVRDWSQIEVIVAQSVGAKGNAFNCPVVWEEPPLTVTAPTAAIVYQNVSQGAPGTDGNAAVGVGAASNGTVVAPTENVAGLGSACAAYQDVTGASAVTIVPIEVWINGAFAWCWDFGNRTAAALLGGQTIAMLVEAVQPLYPNGTAAGSLIFDSLPCSDQFYSDAVGVYTTVVNATTPYDF
ncbi:hypothetical protein HK101_005802, partial [Irineochytrium annulatum]